MCHLLESGEPDGDDDLLTLISDHGSVTRGHPVSFDTHGDRSERLPDYD